MTRGGVRRGVMTVFLAAAGWGIPQAASAQGTVRGTVTDEAGRPVSGVEVRFADGSARRLTPDDGSYRITGVGTGSHTVEFSRIGYATHSAVVTVADDETVQLDVVLVTATIVLDRLVVVGSRAPPRSTTESMVPVDVVPVSDLARQGDSDLSTLLRNVVPSYNVTAEPISDAASISRPASIRNLAPDHTLVLVNGKRRHRSAVIVLFGGNGVADGAQAPDVATLPSIAMSRVEVLSLGTALGRGPLTVTADYFNVAVSGRIALSNDYILTPAEVEQLLREGVEAARNLRQFRYYNNDFSTRTQGVDVVAAYSPPSMGGNTTFSLLINHTRTAVTDHGAQDPDGIRVRQLEQALPTTRGGFSATHRTGSLRLIGRANYFSSWWDHADEFTYSGKLLLDAEGAYDLSHGVTLTMGAENILDTYPDENPRARSGVGNLYSQHSPFGFQGALFYVKASYSFEW